MDLYFLLILLIVSTLAPLFLLLQRKNEKLPPGPFKLPIIGNMHQEMGDLPHHALHRLSKLYGPIMFLQLGSKPALVISSPDMLKQIFKTQDAIFSGRLVLHAAEKLAYNCSDMVFASYGLQWREVRNLTVLELLNTKKVQSFRAIREEEVALMIASLRNFEGPTDLSDALVRLANDIICRATFGRKCGWKDEFHSLLLETEGMLGELNVADFFPWLRWIHKIDGLDAKLEKNYRKLDEFYNELIEEHLDPKRTKAEEDDFIDVMLRVQRDDMLKIKLTNNHMKGLLMNMLLAATSSTSTALVWTMTEIIKNPRIMNRAKEEVRTVVGKKAMVEETDLPRLNYIKMTLKEAMRLHPTDPLLVPRETTDKCIIQGYNLPAKTRVFINVKSIMEDARTWEKPEEFWPEHFQDKPINFKGQEYDFIPFGLGRRICPGIHFALSTIELILANLLHCFDWELPEGMEKESIDIRDLSGITAHKKFALYLLAKSSNSGRNT